ncbi:membrane-binding protein [Capnocytophaga sp.]|uniref:membrane-binding protein n=1 Tax=Capnocytophaga sp. TaxID=44737 RepID=UPI0026DB75E9|nr:membrane-binding protein [Capnocytophaga sp.]MDO5105406.1 membrane-binding protein [Capnocytophaga sp.]
MPKSYAERMALAKVLIDGLRESKDSLPAGITEEAIDEIENLRNDVERLNSEQERLKAELKMKTEEAAQKLKMMDERSAKMRKRIKLDYEQALWRKFGIDDKR